VAKWQLTFTEDFYEQIFRLWKQTYNKQKQKRPAFFGHLTNRYIYEPIKDGVVLDGTTLLTRLLLYRLYLVVALRI
jgi:hypothetical protein